MTSDELKEPDGAPHTCPVKAVDCPHPDCEHGTTANVLLGPDGVMLTRIIYRPSLPVDDGEPKGARWVWHAPMPKVEEPDAEVVRLRKWVNDLQSGMFINCVYCGHRYGPKDEVPTSMADVLKAHIEQCPKHPMSALKTELVRVSAESDRHASDLAVISTTAGKAIRDRKELIDLLSDAAPLTWVAEQRYGRAQDWEKRAANVIADFHGHAREFTKEEQAVVRGGPEWLTWKWGWEALDCCLMAWGPGDNGDAHTILEASNVDKEMQEVLLSDAFRQAVAAVYRARAATPSMDYDHPLLRDMKLTEKAVFTLKGRMDDDLAGRLEEARCSGDPMKLAQAIAELSGIQANRLAE